jgi:hypothetical protein
VAGLSDANITFFALLLALFETVVGLLLIGKGQRVKAGLILSILVCLFLVQMGLGIVTSDPRESFLFNRLPMLVMIALQVPLLWGWDERSIPEFIRDIMAA